MTDTQSSEAHDSSFGKALWLFLRREFLLAARQKGEWVNPLFFFVMVITLFPLAVGPDKETLQGIASGVVWIAALLATLIAVDGLFKPDFEEGALDQLLVSPQPLYLMVVAKVLVHWFLTGFLLTILAPVLGVMLFLEAETLGVLVITLLLGTPVLSFISAIGAALTVGLRRGGVLISLIALPLYIPVLIFGAGAVQASVEGYTYQGQLAVLGALLALAITLAPFAIAGALRISASQ